MKICPLCQTAYQDDSQRFCLNDGGALVAAGNSSGRLALIIGAVAAALLVGGALIVGLIVLNYSSNSGGQTAGGNARREIASGSPTPDKSEIPRSSPIKSSNQSASENGGNQSQTAADSKAKTKQNLSSDVEFTGTASNQTAGQKSNFTAAVGVDGDDDYYLSLQLDNKNLFGRVVDMPGREVECAASLPAETVCVKFDGSIIFGNDGSGIPPNTKAPFTTSLNFSDDGKRARGDFEIGLIPGYKSTGKQRGTVVMKAE